MRDNIETNYLIFISSDGKKSGFDIFNERVQENKWPIYNKTPQLKNVKEGKDIVFYIAGDGEKMDLWKKESNFLNNIIFTGWVGKNELHYISSKSNIGLMAYAKGAPQGLPNKVFEYMASGLPILSSLQTETKELIKKNKIGLSYIPNNQEDLLSKILTLVSNKKLLKEMRYNSIKTFKEKFDSEIIYENLVKFLIENKI